MDYVIDVKEEKKPSLGRISAKAAMMLRGKNTPAFKPNVAPKVKVKIVNANALQLSEGQLQEIYLRYSGYPGGQKSETVAKVLEEKGVEEIFRRAVYGMLPDNKLRAVMMKNLEVTE
jgi:large subunit ribosomal protein L13